MTDTNTEMTFEKPTDIAVIRFAAARAKEIATLTKIMENPTSTKLICQKLPPHMRRRAVSHNPNRMPRALREAHKNQWEKSGGIATPKRPRRKYRRRPGRLLEEYTRRSRTVGWLETHIWHAKRFHMETKWGIRLPARSCDRSHRFCYRSSAHHCLLMDVSYLRCIELCGVQSEILGGLACLTSPKLGLTFAATSLLSGNREGRLFVYRKGQYPSGVIGAVTFMWRYGEAPDAENCRTLWLWSHAAFHDELASELRSALSPAVRLACVGSGQQSLNRFRLRGPLSHQVLGALLEEPMRSTLASRRLAPSFILATTIKDPRLTLPTQRRRPERDCAEEATVDADDVNVDVELSRSSLWQADIRDQVTASRKAVPDDVINRRRRRLLVPGTALPPHADDCAVPVLIVNAPHEGGDRYVPGCDLILPAGWGTAFWLSLIFNGGRAGSLADARQLHFEHGVCADLQLAVDSAAGAAEALAWRADLCEAYFKRPPKTRSNHIKLATPFPFGVDWRQLVSNWRRAARPDGAPTDAVSDDDDDSSRPFYVLRDRALLRRLSAGGDAELSGQPALVAVSLTLLCGGCPGDLAMICLPLSGEKPELTKGRPIVEPPHKDPGARQRKALRLQHRAQLTQLARKRREQAKNEAHKKKDEVPDGSDELKAAYREKMRSLWLPGPCNLVTAFQRSVMGFVQQGDFGLSSGQGLARGYVAVAAVAQLGADRHVLVRNAATDHYLWARLTLS